MSNPLLPVSKSIIALLLLVCRPLHAQPALTITYDHYRGTLSASPSLLSVPHGSLIQFNVINVNPFVYTVTVKTDVISRYSEVPGAFSKAIATPAKETAPQAVPAPAPPPPESRKVPPFEKLTREELEDAAFAEKLSDVDNLLREAHSLAGLLGQMREIVYSDSVEPHDIRSKVGWLSQREPPFQDAWREVLDALQRSVNSLARLTKERHKPSYEARKKEIETLGTQSSSVLASLKDADALWRAVDTARFDGPTVTLQASGDFTTIELKSALKEGQHGTREFDLKPFLSIESPGGLKIDFSTGIMASSLRDPSYIVNAEGKIERSGYENAAAFSVAALLHAYKRGSGVRFPGVSFGLGVSTDRLNYFLGASVLGVAEKRIVLTAGLVVGQVKLLGGGHQEGDAFDAKNGNIPTEQKFRFGGFVGISYNLTSTAGQSGGANR